MRRRDKRTHDEILTKCYSVLYQNNGKMRVTKFMRKVNISTYQFDKFYKKHFDVKKLEPTVTMVSLRC